MPSTSLRELPARIGITPGARVVLSADITRLAWMFRRSGLADVPRNLLDAFLAHLGPAGTLVIPTFNHDLRSGDTYDPLHTAPITGSLAAAALMHPAFRRTRHPLHSFAIAGSLQAHALKLDDPSSFSAGSPFAMFRSEAFITVGMDMELDLAFSYFHHVEELEQVPYRRWRDLAITYVEHGIPTQRRYRSYAKRRGYANTLRELAPLLEGGGALKRSSVGAVRMLLVDIPAAHAVIEKDIRMNQARSIVQFTWRCWLRDVWRSLLPATPVSRPSLGPIQHHARPH